MCRFNYNLKCFITARRGFTLVEVVSALAVLTMLLTSVMVLMNRYIDAVRDMGLRQEAFELARMNMETLLTENRLSDTAEFGTSEVNPDIEWTTIVEPFYEPITNRMWVRAVCTAEYLDTEGEYQEIELEHWITSLSAAQVKQILAQQEAEDEYMNLLNEGGVSDIQETTLEFLRQEGMDTEAYEDFIDKQRRKKIKYLSENGTEKWDAFLEELAEEENVFLESLGMDFERYNGFAAIYVPRGDRDSSSSPDTSDPFDSTPEDPFLDPDTPSDESPDTTEPDSPKENENNDSFDWSRVPDELVPLIEKLLGIKKE